MNYEITLRYALELSVLIPGALFAFMPVAEYMRFKSVKSYITFGALMMISILISAYFSSVYAIRSRDIFIPCMVILFVIYAYLVNMSLSKKIFCFFNSVTICSTAITYTVFLTAPDELTNPLWFTLRLFTFRSSIICACLMILTGIIFFRTLTKKIPDLLHEEHIKDAWKYMSVMPFVLSVLAFWMIPLSPAVVMTGRVRVLSLVLYMIIPLSAFMFCHVFWRTMKTFGESAKLKQENTLLIMESKRYSELRTYMERTRTLRHDFRQHLLVISQLAESNDTDKLRSYISELNTSHVIAYRTYSANPAVDALAAYYDSLANSINIKLELRFELPAELPVKESDFCAMLGNLIDNALRAVKNLPEESRRIKINALMLSSAMLGLSVSNHYDGNIIFGNNGLPVSQREGHGLGLISVSNTVKHYGGSMNITSGNNIFTVEIILFCNS